MSQGSGSRRRSIWLVCFAACALLRLADPAGASAQNLTARGRLQRQTPNGWFPVVGLVVTVRTANPGSFVRSLPAYSGSDGMYYLNGVPPGQYYLEIWVPNAPQPFLVLPIMVAYAATPYGYLCDIPPVNVP